MMKKIINFIALFSVVILFASCQKEQKQSLEGNAAPVAKASIKGQIINSVSDKVTVSLRSIHSTIEAKSVTASIDEEGRFSLEIEVPKASFARLKHGSESTGMYLSPNDDLVVSLDPEEFDETITYQGNGAEINNFLAEAYLLEENILEGQGKRKLYQATTEEFTQLADQIKTEKMALLEKKLYDRQFREFVAMEKVEILSSWASNYRNFEAYYPYYHEDEMQPTEVFETYMNQIDLKNEAALASPTFRSLLADVTDDQAKELLPAELQETDDWQAQYRAKYDSLYDFVQRTYKGETKTFLSANVILDHMQLFGALEDMGSKFEDFNKNYKNSPYYADINNIYNKWQTLAKGQPAHDFTYVDTKGEMVSLSDFKGKVVYVDVWASWCGPCKREIPFSKKMKEHFKDAEDVVFMYVSVDDSKEDWEEFLAKTPEMSGLQLWADGWSEITKDYMINAIPRFMLFDQAGNIVSVKAPRPSSQEEIYSLIESVRQQATASTK